MPARMPRQLALLPAAAVLLGACASAPRVAEAPATTASTTSGAAVLADALTRHLRDEPTASASEQPQPAQLPRGGREVFPAYRLIGYAGFPGSPALGRLGVGKLEDRVAELEPLATAYAAGRQGLPVLELIATVVRASPGADGLYRSRVSDAVIERHLAAARAARGYLLLNIQPGRADFLDEVRSYERWLREPDVGVALDPEWAIGPGQIPGRVFGRTSGAELNTVAAYVSALVAEHDLPEKVLLYHQLAARIVEHPEAIAPHRGVAFVVSVDGIGSMAMKVATWERIVALTPAHVHRGFKLFYEEDRRTGPLMTPEQVLGLVPQPEYVLYE